jgi:hypothetical protein
MLAPGTYHVITLGRRFVRDAECGIVGNQLEHAEKHESQEEALGVAYALKAEARRQGVKKPITVQTITITEVEV